MVLTDLGDPAYEEEFNAWYNTEHYRSCSRFPGVLDAARYVAVKGGPNISRLTSSRALTSSRRPIQGPDHVRPGAGAVHLRPSARTAPASSASRSSRMIWRTPTAAWRRRSDRPDVGPRERRCRMERLVQRRVHPRLSQGARRDLRPAASRSSRAMLATQPSTSSRTRTSPRALSGVTSARVSRQHRLGCSAPWPIPRLRQVYRRIGRSSQPQLQNFSFRRSRPSDRRAGGARRRSCRRCPT